MVQSILQKLQILRQSGYRGSLPAEGEVGTGERALCDELNALLADHQSLQGKNRAFRARLLSDIDRLAGTFGHISLGCFDVPVPEVQLREMETLRIGVQDMAAKLKTASTALEEKVEALERNELALRKERELAEAAVLAKSQFLANMSHELRTPLNAVIGFSSLALRGDPDPRLRGYLKKIESSAKILLNVINDILDFSKIEAGQLALDQVDFQLRELLEQISDMFSAAVAEKGIEIVSSIGEGVPCAIHGDAVRLRQVLINLVSNAVKFTERGEIRIGVVTETCDETRVRLQFSVRDTGIGIDQDDIQRLFTSFMQVDSSTTRRYGGTGLGLAISKRLVELMGGVIGVTSARGQGSTFAFTVEFGRQPSINEVAVALPSELHGRRVLVVEDNPASREMLCELLTCFSLQPTPAADGVEALAALRRGADGSPFDLVVIDWKMPSLDGIDTTRLIRADPDLQRTPVIMLTAYGTDALWKQAQQAGVQAFLLKPVKQSQLFDALVEVFLQKRRSSSDGRMSSNQADILLQIKGVRVLLVEDNSINQQVALEMLHNAQVHVDVASDGIEAFTRLTHTRYDLVLMDVQMPIMDGYAATRAIRSGRLDYKGDLVTLPDSVRGIPIIAMTAHALKGDRDRCLEAGMDDYIKKPVEIDSLYSTLTRWTRVSRRVATAVARPAEQDDVLALSLPSRLPGFDFQAALRRLNGNSKLLTKLLLEFRRDQVDAPQRIRQGLSRGDSDEALRVAHTLKGVAGVFSAKAVQEAAASVENAIRTQNDTSVSVHLDALDCAMAEALESARVFCNEVTESPSQPSQAAQQVPSIPAEVGRLLSDLAAHLRQRSWSAIQSLDNLRSAIQAPEYNQRLSTLQEEIERFDFKAGLATLACLADDLGLALAGE